MSLLDFFARARERLENQRKSPRHLVQCPAWIDTGAGTQKRDCTICDVSEYGARVMIDSPETVPTDFWLEASNDQMPRRRCRVVWETHNQIGVSYIDAPKQ